jgi:hypothetical protein
MNRLPRRVRRDGKGRVWRRIIPICLLALIAAGCGSKETAASKLGISADAFTNIVEGGDDYLAAGSERTASAWIGYVDGDHAVRIENGHSIPLGDMRVNFQVTPYPPTEFDVAAELTVTDSAGAPIDVTVDAWYDMVFMTHGPLYPDISSSTGRVEIGLDLFMVGPWVVKASVDSGQSLEDIVLVIYVWPNT